jgi:hypothetical protein
MMMMMTGVSHANDFNMATLNIGHLVTILQPTKSCAKEKQT